MTEPVRKQIGDYEIIRELGHGGMGQVFLVRNLISDRIEAMKVLLPDLANQGDLAARFSREIKLLASLDHPNIAALRTAFSADNQFIMVMEYVEGDTLAHRLERGPFPPAEALNYIDQVLAALSYAHAQGVIHRDIKPANMMLTPRGVLKLMDFGIARSGNDLGLTVTGTTLGSLDYMSPEQVQSQPTDARSDLYSVGVSLYEMVTGKRMFSATSSYSIMEAHIKETPRPPIEVQASLPKPLSDLIVMAVAKNPAERFQTADAFRNALSQIRESCGSPSSEKNAVGNATTITGVQAVPAIRQTPVSQATPVGQSAARAGVSPANAATQTDSQLKRDAGSRHPFLILAIAIVLLVATLAGARAYRIHKQNEAAAAAMVAMNEGNPPPTTPKPAPAAPAPAPPQAAPPASQPTAEAAAPQPPAAESKANHARTNAMAAASAAANANAQQEQAALEQQKKLLDAMEIENDHLESRAAAVESSLEALEAQMHQSGLGLRGDMVSSRASMRTDMAKAKQALDNSDTERARRYLDQANAEISKLEGFLGRR